jgi:hypothetical protein
MKAQAITSKKVQGNKYPIPIKPSKKTNKNKIK